MDQNKAGKRRKHEGLDDLEQVPDAEIVPGNGDIRPDLQGEDTPPDPSVKGGTRPSLEEEDDNPFQRSDEALPDDEEEQRLRRNPSREGGLFDEY